MELIGVSPALNNVKDLIHKVANTNANVLILGESGTGKELVAKKIHELSTRAQSAFIPVNCGAIPEDLLESELFGHEKGAFTGAVVTRVGRFELANSGSIFLDEIGDMPLIMQVKLLRVLQEKTFERVGGNKSIKTNARVIAATHRNLLELIGASKFREDLYYRLNVFPIELPPLRERMEDLETLTEFFLDLYKKTLGANCTLDQSVIDNFYSYSWPGNIRELSNIIERLCILHQNQKVLLHHLPQKFLEKNINDSSSINNFKTTVIHNPHSVSSLSANFNLKEHLEQLEISYIHNALNESSGVVTQAAKLLGFRRTTLVEKMKKYKIKSPINRQTVS